MAVVWEAFLYWIHLKLFPIIGEVVDINLAIETEHVLVRTHDIG